MQAQTLAGSRGFAFLMGIELVAVPGEIIGRN